MYAGSPDILFRTPAELADGLALKELARFLYDVFRMPTWNITSNLLDTLPGDRRGLVALAHDASRHEWTFGEITHVSSRFAGTLRDRGVEKGDVVLTYMGNTPEWVFALTACWQLGAVAMPCNTQLTPHDPAKRVELVGPALCLVNAPRADAPAARDFEL